MVKRSPKRRRGLIMRTNKPAISRKVIDITDSNDDEFTTSQTSQAQQGLLQHLSKALVYVSFDAIGLFYE